MLCTALDIRIHGLFFVQIFARLFNHIQRYYGIFAHIETLSNHIKVYSSISGTLCQPCIFTTLPYSESWHIEPKAYLKPSETLTRHFRTLPHGIIEPYLGIFRTLYKACIFTNLAYSESWNLQNPSIIISRCIFRTLSYLRKFTNIQNSNTLNPTHKKTGHIFRTLSKI